MEHSDRGIALFAVGYRSVETTAKSEVDTELIPRVGGVVMSH